VNLTPGRKRRLRWIPALASAAVLASSCGGSLFRVKPAVDLPPLPANAKSLRAAGVTIKVAPLLSDEESQDLFEANLPLSGVLPLRVELNHEGGVPVELNRARFRLRDASGGEWKVLSTKQATSRILKANGVFAYNPHSRKRFVEEFGAYALDVKTPFTVMERRRQGFLFFATPKKEPVTSHRELIFSIERLSEPVEIRLN
jgi:hypothetical protein